MKHCIGSTDYGPVDSMDYCMICYGIYKKPKILEYTMAIKSAYSDDNGNYSSKC